MTRHPLDLVSLLFGLAFAAIGVVTLATSRVPFDWLDPRVVLPVVAVVAGLWLLATASRRRASQPDGTGDG